VTREKIATMLNAIKDVMTVLRDADAVSTAELYGQLGLRLTYHPAPWTVTARADLGRSCTQLSCRRGEAADTYMPAISAEPALAVAS